VDVYSLIADGSTQIVPDGFSYGPTLLEATPDASTTDGGGTGFLYGYGFGSPSGTTIPSGLQISIGGKQATVTAYEPNAYGTLGPPFLLQGVAYTIPPGAVGAADVTVTTQAGTATLPDGMSYLPAVQQFSLTGASLAQGIYDSVRDLYYFTDAGQIQVFSRTDGKWLSPISVPTAPSGATHPLWGITLSQDGSKLAVSDAGTRVIYLIDPGSTGSVQSFVVTKGPIPGAVIYPAGLAITNTGVIYYAAYDDGGDGSNEYYTLDTNSGTITNLGLNGPGYGESDEFLRAEISSDNTRVFFNNDGDVFSIDTATGQQFYSLDGPGCCYGDYDLALSSDQTQLEGTSYLYDTDLNGQSYLALNLRESANITYVFGTKFSPDGSLLFQPSTYGIDIFDGRVGTLSARIALPFALSQSFDSLVSDGKDNVLIAITGTNGTGIAIVDLSSMSEPPPLPYPSERSHRGAAMDESPTPRSSRVSPTSAAPAQMLPNRGIKHIVHGSLLPAR
jgi:hypothetical protein